MPTTPSAPDTNALVSAEGLGRRFGRRRVLQDIDLELEPGSVAGIVGPNGAGKTTLLRLLLGILAPTAGQVRMAEGLPDTPLAVGAMLESDGLLPQLTGAQTLATWARLAGRLPEGSIDETLDRVGLAGAAHRKVRSYSFGMRRRLVLARALLGPPRLLVLDEPGNGLDPAGLVQLQRLIRTQAAAGTAVLVSSHSLTEIDELCEQVHYLSAGRFIQHWAPNSPRWWALHVQNGRHQWPTAEERAIDTLSSAGWQTHHDAQLGVLIAQQNDLSQALAQLSAAGLDVVNVTDLGRDLQRPFRESESWESQ